MSAILCSLELLLYIAFTDLISEHSDVCPLVRCSSIPLSIDIFFVPLESGQRCEDQENEIGGYSNRRNALFFSFGHLCNLMFCTSLKSFPPTYCIVCETALLKCFKKKKKYILVAFHYYLFQPR